MSQGIFLRETGHPSLLRRLAESSRFIELAGYINGQMPLFVVEKIQNALNEHSKPLKGSKVLVLGVAYKREIDDVRESPALDIIHLLKRRGGLLQRSLHPHAHHRRAAPHVRRGGAERGCG